MVLATAFVTYLWFLRRFSRRRYWGRIFELPFGLILKVVSPRGAPEGEIIRFVQRHTSIPTPRVLVSVDGHGRRFLLMKKVRGSTLESVWSALDAAQRAKIVAQLRSFVAQLRSLDSPHGLAVCGLGGAPIVDSRITSCGPVGPFLNEDAFNDRLVQTSALYIPQADLSQIRARMRGDHAIVFTHGDIAPRNIIVDGDKIAALIDWQQAGWFPEHWEWIKAMWCPPDPKSAAELWEQAVKELFEKDYEPEWLLDRELSDDIVGAF
ncbi:kinase-like protein [Trametes punicea]|nr:kinase-like protein [Trametes punicea]